MIRLRRGIERNRGLIVVVARFPAALSADDGSEPLYDLVEDTELLEDLPCNTATVPSQGKEHVLRADKVLVLRLRMCGRFHEHTAGSGRHGVQRECHSS